VARTPRAGQASVGRRTQHSRSPRIRARTRTSRPSRGVAVVPTVGIRPTTSDSRGLHAPAHRGTCPPAGHRRAHRLGADPGSGSRRRAEVLQRGEPQHLGPNGNRTIPAHIAQADNGPRGEPLLRSHRATYSSETSRPPRPPVGPQCSPIASITPRRRTPHTHDLTPPRSRIATIEGPRNSGPSCSAEHPRRPLIPRGPKRPQWTVGPVTAQRGPGPLLCAAVKRSVEILRSESRGVEHLGSSYRSCQRGVCLVG